MLDALPTADVYNLHWIAGFLDYRAFFSKVGNRVPIVWTLHDMNQFTGGCHYTAGCQKFLEECGRCPALGSDHANDLAYRIYRRKRAVFESLDPSRIRIVADSRWLETVASKSALLERFTVTCIPYGLDVENFQPRNQAIARNVFGIPPDAKVVMFAAQSLGNHRKGMDLLIEAIRSLRVETQVILLAVGSGRVPDDIGRTCISTGKLNSERFLSFAYSAADVFVSPAREEAFGQVNLESIACGTPVVAFKVGGIPDVVRPGKTGLLAAPEDVRSLREAMETILADRPLRDTMSQECRQVALREYTLELQAGRYKHLYEELIQSILRQPYTSAPLEAVTV
ncbi:MAG: glycosyltransferase [Candidatus Sulfotelmatobacter sp.]